MKQVVIDRSQWGQRYLHNTRTNKQCCLGFACQAYGVPVSEMRGVGMPSHLSSHLQDRLPKWMVGDNPSWRTQSDLLDASLAAKINDDPNLSWDEREELLKPIFQKHQIELVFIGERS
jgi:hypothetical protein